MLGVVADESKPALCDDLTAGSVLAPANAVLMLYDTIAALTHATVLATLAAHEVAVAGYARQPVTAWGASVLTADFHARSQGNTLTFTNSSGGASSLITGWALVDSGAGKIIQSGLYDTPFTIPAGQVYLTTPFFTFTGEIGVEP